MALRALPCFHVKHHGRTATDDRKVTMRLHDVTILCQAQLCANCSDLLNLGSPIPLTREYNEAGVFLGVLSVWLSPTGDLPPVTPRPVEKLVIPAGARELPPAPKRLTTMVPRKIGAERDLAIAGLAKALERGEIGEKQFRAALKRAMRTAKVKA